LTLMLLLVDVAVLLNESVCLRKRESGRGLYF
jgi:hypothetical protein